MSYKKWIYKYHYLQAEKEEHEYQAKLNTKEFIEYFEEKDPSTTESISVEEPSSSPKIPDNPGKSLYKKLSKILHPDKGGDEDEFVSISLMYRNQDTIGLYLKAEEYNIDVENLLTEELISSFESSCENIEEEIEKIKSTVSWVWCNTSSPEEKESQEKTLELKFGLVPKKK